MGISPPRPRGPALNALRAFEAAARHGSFTRAAAELCVTAGAVAQQVKSLESWSGTKLFRREAHGVRLTPLGNKLLPEFVQAFDTLGSAIQSLRSQANPEQVRIAALPSVAQLWLSPRLPQIRAAHKDIVISVVATETPPNLKRELFDISIFFEDLPGDSANTAICRDRIFPVCAAEIANQLENPADLSRHPCLHDSSWDEDWQHWLQAAEPGQLIDTSGPVYSLYSLMLEETQNGAGVMMGHEALVRRQLQSGALVAPFDTEVELDRRLSIASAMPLTPGSLLHDLVTALAR